MTADVYPPTDAGAAFDTLAAGYDEHFTRSRIGRAQREAVWLEAAVVFGARTAVLELNCGTGEDALFLTRRGHRITALDASSAMIACAVGRKAKESPGAPIDFRVLPTEHLADLPVDTFDAVFSNFSGLNCVRDLRCVAGQLARRTRSGTPVLLCLSTRVCLWETLWFAVHGAFRKAARRWSGSANAKLNGVNVRVYYPTVRDVAACFSPSFTLHSVMGIGIFVPPSYLEPWMCNRSRTLKFLCQLDRFVCKLPIFRSVGDHVMLQFVRSAEEVE